MKLTPLSLLVAATCVLSFSGCLDLGTVASTNSGAAQVSNVKVASNMLTITGTNLDSVTALQLQQGTTTTRLIVNQKSPTSISAAAASPLTLAVGAAYSLLVSTAKADTTLPITIQLDSNSLKPSSLRAGGATVGQVLQWNGTAWTPVTLAAGTGGTPAPSFYLAYINGTIIGPLVEWNGATTEFVVWDNVNNLSVLYGTRSNPGYLSASQAGSFYLYYSTTDCSDSPHSAGTAVNDAGAMPEVEIGLGGDFYKIESTSDTFVARAQKAEVNGALGTCTTFTTGPSATYWRATKITTPGLPYKFSAGTFKVIRQ